MPMKVTHLIKATRIAGAERHLLILLPGLKDLGFTVRMILMVEPDKPVDDFANGLASQGVPVERIVIRRHSDVGVIGKIRTALLNDKPDILHTHLIHADLFGAAAGRLAGVRHLVVSRHNDDPFRTHPAIKLLNRAIWASSGAGIAISEAIRRFCIEVEGASPRKIRTIHYGLPPQPALDLNQTRADLRRELNLPEDAPVAGMVCRLIEQKGVSFALQAFAQLADKHPAAHLAIVGDGPLRPALEAEAGALGIAGRTHFLGWRDDAARSMAGFDMLLMPSLWEGFGIVMLEAMAAAVPIIGSDVSAIPEVVVNNETGYLFSARDVDALATALDVLLSDKPLRRHMGLLGQERLETVFDADRMVVATADLYEGLKP